MSKIKNIPPSFNFIEFVTYIWCSIIDGLIFLETNHDAVRSFGLIAAAVVALVMAKKSKPSLFDRLRVIVIHPPF